MTRKCVVVDVDGAPMRVQTTGKPLSQQDMDALTEFARFLHGLTKAVTLCADCGRPRLPHTRRFCTRCRAITNSVPYAPLVVP